MIHWLLVLAFFGCVIPTTSLPTGTTKSSGPIEVGKVPLVERTPTLTMAETLPQPEAPLDATQCNELEQGGGVDGCLTAEIQCGETVIGHTRGGVKQFDTEFYKAKFCTPNTSNHDGGDERVYRLRMPEGDHRAILTLDTPCADLDMAAILWNEEGCPNNAHVISRCEMLPKSSTAREQLEIMNQHANTWLIVVEGKGNEEGPFGLTVQCLPGFY